MGLTDLVIAALSADTPPVPAAVADRPAGMGSGPGVVIYPDGPVRTAATIGKPSGTETTVLVCHCIGLTPDSAVIAEKKLAAAVFGLYGASVDGQTVMYPEQDWAQPMKRDDDVSPPLYDLAVEWRLRTTPTS